MCSYVNLSPFFCSKPLPLPSPATGLRRSHWALRLVRCLSTTGETSARVATVKNGSDSLEICRVINGMWQVSSAWGSIDSIAAVESMLSHADAGLKTFDMSNHYGSAEELYGTFINRVRRERPPEFLEEIKGLTKWVPTTFKMTSNFVRDSINTSRKRMDVASLDMLQFHWWDYSYPGYLDALKHLADLKEEGKIKTLALTNFDTERLHIILENGIPIVSNQVQHSVIDMRPQQKMAELCRLTGVQLITYGTVMGGLLSEKFLDANLSIPSLNTPSLQKYKKTVDAWGDWSLFQVLLQTLKTVATKHGVSIPTVAVRYVLNQASVAGSMIGVRLGLSDHIKDTCAILSLVLDEEDMNSITEGNVGLIFTKDYLKEVSEEVAKFKVGAPARVGLVAPIDVVVPPGNTGLDPSQTSFFQVLNIPTKINKGTVEIITPVELIKKGDKVGSSEAALLAKLGIRPFSYGLVVQSVYEDGSVFSPEVLDLTEDDLIDKFSAGLSMVTALSLALSYPTLAAAPHMFINAYKNVLAVAVATDYTYPQAEKVKEYLKYPNKFTASAAPAASAATPAAAAAPAAAVEEKKEEPAEESDDDMAFSLFD